MKAASLKGALLARKGTATPTAETPPKLMRQQEPGKAADAPNAAAGAGADRPAPVRPPAQSAPAADQGPKASTGGERIRLSVRLEAETHRRLKLLSAYTQDSIQDILAHAIDAYIEQVAPDLWSGIVTCLVDGKETSVESGHLQRLTTVPDRAETGNGRKTKP